MYTRKRTKREIENGISPGDFTSGGSYFKHNGEYGNADPIMTKCVHCGKMIPLLMSAHLCKKNRPV